MQEVRVYSAACRHLRSQCQLAGTMQATASVFFAGNTDDTAELLNESMAEAARSHQWQRVFPCLEDPNRYLDKFEMQRTDTKRVCQALKDWDSQGLHSSSAKKVGHQTGRAWR